MVNRRVPLIDVADKRGNVRLEATEEEDRGQTDFRATTSSSRMRQGDTTSSTIC